MDSEQLYQAIQNEDWKQILDFLHKRTDIIKTDYSIQYALQVFEKEFLNKIKSYPIEDKSILQYLEKLYMLHQGKYFILENDSYEFLIEQIVNRHNTLKNKYQYASLCPDNKICKPIIDEYEQSISKEIKHSQSDFIDVSENSTLTDNDFRICLFKSSQEKDFFYALRNVFETYQIYPNVATSCLLSWEQLQPTLAPEEKDYFFKCIIDFVVFDQAKDFLPKYFFELDSVYHDSPEQKHKDDLKDSIFSKAGIKILRIRKKSNEIGENDFTNLIREIIE